MNENIIRIFHQRSISKYALAHRSGVPYTTVSEILNQKTDINKCAAETVFRLAAVLQAEPRLLLNEIHILDGTQGKYNGVRYTLRFNGNDMDICFIDDNEPVVLHTGQRYKIPERRDDYLTFVEWRIDEYLQNKEFDRHAQAAFGETA